MNAFEYQPRIRREPREIESPPSYTLPKVDKVDQLAEDEKLVGQEMLVVDSMIDIMEGIIDDQTKNLNIPVGADRPSLLNAIKAFGGDNTITQDVWKKAMRTLENSVGSEFGYDPTTLAFATKGANGLEVPTGEGKVAENCEEAAAFEYNPKPDAPTVPIKSIKDQKDRQWKLNLFLMLWAMVYIKVLTWFKTVLSKFAIWPLKKIVRGIIKKINKIICKTLKNLDEKSPGTTDVLGVNKKEICKESSEHRQIKVGPCILGYEKWRKHIIKQGKTGEIDKRPESWYNDEQSLEWATVEYTDKQKEKLMEEEEDGDEKTEVVGTLVYNQDDIDKGNYPQLVKLGNEALSGTDLGLDLEASGSTDAPFITIPPDCINNAGMIVDTVNEWATGGAEGASTMTSGAGSSGVNPSALIMKSMLDRTIDYFEVGKNIYAMSRNSEITEQLAKNTAKRPTQRARWQGPQANAYRSMILGK